MTNNESTDTRPPFSEISLYEVYNLQGARDFLASYNKPVILTNYAGTTRYYGMRVLDYMFKILTKEFEQIIQIIVNVEDDNAALFTAIDMNYKNINYSGMSKEILLMLNSMKQRQDQ